MHRKNKIGAQIYLFSSLGIKLQFTGWCGRHKDTHIDQGNRIDFRPQLIFNKLPRHVFSTDGAETAGYPQGKKINLDPYLTP